MSKLRFLDENGEHYPEWGEERLGSLFEFKKGKGLPKDSLTEYGKFPAIHYGELFTVYKNRIDKIISNTNHEDGANGLIGDILLPTSDVTSYGLATASTLNVASVKIGADVMILRPLTNKTYSEYYSQVMTYQKSKIIQRVVGTTVKHIYSKDLSDLKYPLPSLPEQEKIAEFLGLLDERIETQHERIKLLQQQKKAWQQKIFTQQYRFTDENGELYAEWEQKTLGEVVECLDNQRKPITSSNRKEGKFPYYGSTNIQGWVDGYIFDEELVLLAEDAAPFDEYFNKPIAQNIKGKTWVNNHAHVLRAKYIYITNNFLFQTLVNKNIVPFVNGISRMKLTKKDMLTIPIPLPSLPEQEKIAEFLGLLDEEIELESQRMTLLEDEKQAYLQRIFAS